MQGRSAGNGDLQALSVLQKPIFLEQFLEQGVHARKDVRLKLLEGWLHIGQRSRVRDQNQMPTIGNRDHRGQHAEDMIDGQRQKHGLVLRVEQVRAGQCELRNIAHQALLSQTNTL